MAGAPGKSQPPQFLHIVIGLRLAPKNPTPPRPLHHVPEISESVYRLAGCISDDNRDLGAPPLLALARKEIKGFLHRVSVGLDSELDNEHRENVFQGGPETWSAYREVQIAQ
ncbi:hypothetical protein GP2_076_00050 [Gordonia paraffinivorans NBRC 108238]|uniref:Uncharacterized protein n=1 Tax=Gordonia paraffinivorans NBRC 108238 TaxID=1223543 RepID=A0ABQ0IRX6_9ACTN|nr:hypothetical protein GP2_076_00050 [Gordonia paraffinivorans NBRC 108238]